MRHGTLFILTFLFLFSCKNETQSQTGNDAKTLVSKADSSLSNVSDTTYLDVKGNKYRYLGVIPDSLRTLEQKKLIKLIGEVTYKYMSVKDNHMVFGLTREEYSAKGIPVRYYDLLQKNIQDNNTFIDANGIKNTDRMVRETQEELAVPKKEPN